MKKTTILVGLLLVVPLIASADPYSDLMTGAQKNDLAAMNAALAKGISPNTPNWEGTTPLMMAAMSGSLDAVKLLLEKDADMHLGKVSTDKSKPDGRTAVMYAITNKKNDVMRYLIEKGARINSGDATGYTSLMFAAGSANLEAVKLLLEKGVATDTQDDNGVTAITAAAWGGDMEVLKTILAKAGPESIKHVQWKSGQTALHLAAQKGNLPMVQFLLEKGLDKNSAAGAKAWTPVMEAAWYGKHDVVGHLADKGADLNYVSKDEWTPLMISARKGDIVLANLLIEKGVDVHYTDKNGMNAVIVAALNKKMDVLTAIVTAGGRALYTKL